MPKKIAKIGYERFKFKFYELFNNKGVEGLITNDILRLMLGNKVSNTLPILYTAIEMVINYDLKDETAEKFKQQFKDFYGKFPESKEDLKYIKNQIRKLTSKIKELEPKDEKQEGEFSFENLIGYVELVLNRNIDRNLPLYAFKKRYDEAIKKVKAQDNGKR